MPNWCENILTAPAETLALLRNKEGHADFEALLPTPDDEVSLRKAFDNRLTKLFETALPVPSYTEEEGRYWWHVLNWGTKWNIVESKLEIDDNTTKIYFDTAWSPSREIAIELSRRSQGVEVMIEYCELGNWFAGWDVYVNGNHSADVEIDLSSFEGVKWVRERFYTDFGFCDDCGEDQWVNDKYIQHEHRGE